MNKDRNSFRKGLLLTMDFFIIAILVTCDFVSKRFVLRELKGKGSFIIIENVLQLTYKENKGGFFGVLSSQSLFIMFISAILVFFVFIVLIRIPTDKKFTIANWMLSFILAGAIGNFIDRAVYGNAIDFIYFISVNFPVFNLADLYLAIGSIVILILLIFFYRENDLVFLNIKKAYFRELK